MVKTLIDRAIELCGTQADLARRLNVSRVTIHRLTTEKERLSPEMAVLCAEITGDDPYRCAAEAMVINCKDEKKALQLCKAFHIDPGKRSVTSGVTVYTLSQIRNAGRALKRFFVLMARKPFKPLARQTRVKLYQFAKTQGLRRQTLTI